MRVIFRKFAEGDIIALLPDYPANPGRIMSYMRIGQHAEADREIIANTRPAMPEEAQSLLRELVSIYGKLEVRQRVRK